MEKSKEKLGGGGEKIGKEGGKVGGGEEEGEGEVRKGRRKIKREN